MRRFFLLIELLFQPDTFFLGLRSPPQMNKIFWGFFSAIIKFEKISVNLGPI